MTVTGQLVAPVSGEYVLHTRGRRMPDLEAFNLIEVQVHFDTRCQTVLEQMREARWSRRSTMAGEHGGPERAAAA